MDLNDQPVILLGPFWKRLTLSIETSGNRLEDLYLGTQIPPWIRKHLTFYRLHFVYFLLMSILGTLILFIAHRSDTGEKRFSIVDSIFNAVSVVTVTGLTSVRIADFSMFDRILLLILMTLGCPAFTSLIPLWVRRFYFYRHYRIEVKERLKEMMSLGKTVKENFNDISSINVQKLDRPRKSNILSGNPGLHEEEQMAEGNWEAASTFAAAPQFSSKPLFFSSPGHSMGNEAIYPGHGLLASKETKQMSQDLTVDIVKAFDKPQFKTDQLIDKKNQAVQGKETASEEDIQQYRSFKPGQGSLFNITRTVEHQALVVLTWLVPVYIIICQVAAIGASLVILRVSRSALEILEGLNVNIYFFAVFSIFAAFTNSGVPANDANLVPFQNQVILLLLYTTVSLIGNLLYPACLRFVIWMLHSFAGTCRKPVFKYLLNHPRRCFTHLFPHKQSVWLVITVVGFTVFPLIFFCALDWNSTALAGLSPLSKIVDGIFQSVSARNSGEEVVDIDYLSSSMLVLYLFMMFIATYPVTILRKSSTEYELNEIGIYDKRWQEELTDNSIEFQARKLLARDSAYLCIILFVICLIESKNIEDDPLNFSFFNIIFEIVSAYGGVGMSVGYSCALRLNASQNTPCTDVPYSLSGKWSPLSKIILAIVMLMGRHRGLPDDIDSAIKLPTFNDSARASGGSTPGAEGTPFAALRTEPGRLEIKSLQQTSQCDQHQSQNPADSHGPSLEESGVIAPSRNLYTSKH